MSDCTTVEDFYENFIPTGKTTPACGECYVHKTEDACATVYRDHIDVYTNRRTDINNDDEKFPALYVDKEIIEVE
jgi:hypothetical protein